MEKGKLFVIEGSGDGMCKITQLLMLSNGLKKEKNNSMKTIDDIHEDVYKLGKK